MHNIWKPATENIFLSIFHILLSNICFERLTVFCRTEETGKWYSKNTIDFL